MFTEEFHPGRVFFFDVFDGRDGSAHDSGVKFPCSILYHQCMRMMARGLRGDSLKEAIQQLIYSSPSGAFSILMSSFVAICSNVSSIHSCSL